MMLKVDFHLHSNRDPDDYLTIRFSPEQLIEIAERKGYHALAFTHHNGVFFSDSLCETAKKHGIILIPGTEAVIEGKHVLIYNINQQELSKLNTFRDLHELKKVRGKDMLIIAPHPFFPQIISLQKKLFEHIELFDALEHSHYYLPWLNCNKKAINVSIENHLPLVSFSDTHMLDQLGLAYTLIDAEPNIESIFEAIRAHRVKPVYQPLTIWKFLRITWYVLVDLTIKVLHKIFGFTPKQAVPPHTYHDQ